MYYYQHHIGDFIRDTSNLTDVQAIVYLRMLWKYYADESPLIGPCDRIAFAVRSDDRTVGQILAHYFTETPEGWRHARCDAEIAKFHGKSKTCRDSAFARWNNANASKSDANALRTDSERNADAPIFDANQEPITNNQKPSKIKNKDRDTPAVPDWLPSEAWSDWQKFRKSIRKPLTDRAVALCFKTLDEFRAQGMQPAAVINQSIQNGWTGLFAIKAGTNQKPTAADSFHGKQYTSTPIANMPDFLREAVEQELSNGT